MTVELRSYVAGSGRMAAGPVRIATPRGRPKSSARCARRMHRSRRKRWMPLPPRFRPGARCRRPARGDILRKAADLLEQRAADVGRDLTREEGKTLAEGIGETRRAVQILRYYAGQTLEPDGETYPSHSPGTFLYARREPIGVVVGDHALELSDRHPGLEDRPGAGVRQHASSGSRPSWCPLTRGALAAGAGRRRAAGRRAQPGARQGLGGRRRAGHPRRRARHHVHRLEQRRAGAAEEGHRARARRCSSSWAARTRRWCWPTPTSTWPPNTSRAGRSSAPGRSAPRPVGSSSRRR